MEEKIRPGDTEPARRDTRHLSYDVPVSILRQARHFLHLCRQHHASCLGRRRRKESYRALAPPRPLDRLGKSKTQLSRPSCACRPISLLRRHAQQVKNLAADFESHLATTVLFKGQFPTRSSELSDWCRAPAAPALPAASTSPPP